MAEQFANDNTSGMFRHYYFNNSLMKVLTVRAIIYLLQYWGAQVQYAFFGQPL